MSARRVWLVAVTTAMALLTSCSGSSEFSFGSSSSPDDAAVSLIEDDLGPQLGLGEVDAECNSPASSDVGTRFNCTADVDGQIARFEALIDAEDHINVQSLNVVTADDIVQLDQAATALLEPQVGGGLGPDSLLCGDQSLILDDSREVSCAFVNPNDGLTYDATITITNMAEGAFELSVEDTPR